jgi:hypothetical protein
VTEEEITQAAWKELLSGAESALDDWVDEEGQYGDDYMKIFQRQRDLLRELKQAYR